MYVLKDIIQKYELNAKKSLGQNFILDTNLLSKIARMALSGVDYDALLEVGPGPGGLTEAILEQTDIALNVIEKDNRCAKALQELSAEYSGRLNIYNEDALLFNESKLGKKVCVIANLPYNISTLLLVKWLKNISEFSALTLMFQKEVADRIMAPIRTKDYGRLSVLAQLQCHITKLFDLNPECFTPAPKVWSSVLLFTPKETSLTKTEIKKLESLTSQAFSMRRKMIRQSLKNISNLESLCAEVGIKTNMRPEEISPEQFLALAQRL